jgi:hypothetical protein
MKDPFFDGPDEKERCLELLSLSVFPELEDSEWIVERKDSSLCDDCTKNDETGSWRVRPNILVFYHPDLDYYLCGDCIEHRAEAERIRERDD